MAELLRVEIELILEGITFAHVDAYGEQRDLWCWLDDRGRWRDLSGRLLPTLHRRSDELPPLASVLDRTLRQELA